MNKEEEKLQERERINRLLTIYGKSLSPLKYQDLCSYYRDDLSLSEIAENRHVSRNAVHLNLKQGEKELEKMEKTLHIYEHSMTIYKELEAIDSDTSDEEIHRIITKIKEELKYGI